MRALTDRVAIVTGGARGIGLGIATVLSAEGSTVVIADVDGGAARAAAARLPGPDGIGLAVDVTDRSSVDEALETVMSSHGRVDILAANAGVYPTTPLGAISDQQWDRVMDVNARGVLHCVQACLPAMRTQGYGRVVITASITGPITGYAGFAHYGASKAAVMGFMRSAAIECAPDGITVNAILPGTVRTPGFDASGADDARQAVAIPLGKLAEAEDLGWAVRFLASEEARYITGQGLVVDGGLVLPEGPLALDPVRSA
jgi:3-oxoacyl-[acyl-carrier protein] reductase